MNNQQIAAFLNELPTSIHTNIASKINSGYHLYYVCECSDCKMSFLYKATDDTGVVQKTGSGKRPPSVPAIQLDCQKCKSPKHMSITAITKDHIDALTTLTEPKSSRFNK